MRVDGRRAVVPTFALERWRQLVEPTGGVMAGVCDAIVWSRDRGEDDAWGHGRCGVGVECVQRSSVCGRSARRLRLL